MAVMVEADGCFDDGGKGGEEGFVGAFIDDGGSPYILLALGSMFATCAVVGTWLGTELYDNRQVFLHRASLSVD